MNSSYNYSPYIAIDSSYRVLSAENGTRPSKKEKLSFSGFDSRKKNYVLPSVISVIPPSRTAMFVRCETYFVARTERSHSHDADSHIRYSSFPARGFCHRRRRHCAGRRCHNSVGFALRNATGLSTLSRGFRSVHVTQVYEIQLLLQDISSILDF